MQTPPCPYHAACISAPNTYINQYTIKHTPRLKQNYPHITFSTFLAQSQSDNRPLAPEEREALKRMYRARYKAQWRKSKRQQTKSITITCTLDLYRQLTARANALNRSRTQFVHDALVATLAGHPMSIDAETLGIIREAFLLVYHQAMQHEQTTELSAHLQQLSATIDHSLSHTKPLLHAIRDTLKQNPASRSEILTVLNESPHGSHYA